MKLDLKQFSTDDLVALQSGDVSKLSTPALNIIKRAQQVEALKKSNPTEYDVDSPEYSAKYGKKALQDSMSTTEKVLAGAGKAFADIGRGVGQLTGFTSQAEVDEAKKTDAALMDTTAGKVGNIGGNVAIALPATFIPGAQSLAGAALSGAAMGGLQPVASDESRTKNIGLGAAGGAGGVLAGRVLAAGAKGAKALIEPFTAKGRDAIAARTLNRFGVEAADAAGATSAPTITGARQTLAEQIQRPEAAAGAARLQDSLRSLDPEIAAKMTAREVENNAARAGVLREMAGEGGQREFYKEARTAAGKELYDKAFSTVVDPKALSAAEHGEITKLLKLPALQDAMKDAKIIAANQGINIAKPEGSIEGMHLMKLALDDAIEAAGKGGSAAAVNKAMSIKTARDRLITFMERHSPEYGEARATYAAMSKPLNQMDVAEELFKKGTAATSDLGGTPRLMPDKFVGQLKNEEALVKGATGRNLGKLSEVLDPEQFNKVIAVGKELDRGAAVGRAANGPGSATAQRMASQNVLRQLLGPTGLPESWAESTLLNTAMRPVQFAYNGVAEPRIQQTLADLVMNPARAEQVLKLAQAGGAKQLPKEVQEALPFLEQALKASVPAAALANR